VTRAAFQEMFPGESFDTDRELIGMELDGFSAKYQLAFECDGAQHFERVKHFQRNEGDFEAQQARDQEKDIRAIDADIVLLRIPDRSRLTLKKIRMFVREKVMDLGFGAGTHPAEYVPDSEFYAKIKGMRVRDKFIDQTLDIIHKRGGTSGIKSVPTRTWPIHTVCEKGHEFSTHFDNLTRGRWCPECSGSKPITETTVADFLATKEYRFVSMRSEVGEDGRRRWHVTYRCPRNHEYTATWDNIKSGKNCAMCHRENLANNRRSSPKKVRSILDPKGLTLVSDYSTQLSPLTFQCASNHQFVSTIVKIKLWKPPYCPLCNFEACSYVGLAEGIDMSKDVSAQTFSFRCKECNGIFATTYRAFQTRRYKCPNKQCPSRGK
jgi:hypothetical protein